MSAIALGGSCGPPVDDGVVVICSFVVCVSVVVVDLLSGWRTIGGYSCGCDAGGGGVIVVPVLLMMSNICLSYLSGFGMRLIVLALMTLFLMPRRVSPVAVSLPSQMALKKRCSIFGSCLNCLTVGSRCCTASPNSQSGDLWSCSIEVASVAIRKCRVSVQ